MTCYLYRICAFGNGVHLPVSGADLIIASRIDLKAGINCLETPGHSICPHGRNMCLYNRVVSLSMMTKCFYMSSNVWHEPILWSRAIFSLLKKTNLPHIKLPYIKMEIYEGLFFLEYIMCTTDSIQVPIQNIVRSIYNCITFS